MKKIICLFLTVAFVFVLISCAEQGKPIGTTDGTISSPTSVPTVPSSRLPESTTSEKNVATESTASVTTGTTKATASVENETTDTLISGVFSTGEHGEIATTYIDHYRNMYGTDVVDYIYLPPLMMPEKGIDPHEIRFWTFFGYDPERPWAEQRLTCDSFYGIYSGAYSPKTEMKGYFHGWKKYGFTEWIPVIATAISYDKDQWRISRVETLSCEFYVTLSAYGEEEESDIFLMTYAGRADKPYYGKPMLVPGKRYLRLETAPDWKESKNHLMNGSLLFLIEEQDGVEYVYGMGADLSHMDCAVPITDPYENAVYKPGIDDDIIAYMEEHGIPAPTYDYKCELNAFVKEMNDDID